MAIEIKNQNLFGKVIAEALTAVENKNLPLADKLRWTNAIAKAVGKLEQRSEFFEWMRETEHLLIWSDSNKIYEANGSCQCEAFKRGLPCWHRALAKLIKNYLKSEGASPIPAQSFDITKAPYLKQSGDRKPERIGNIRI